MERRSESLGRLLRAATAAIAAIEGKTQQAIEAELGERIGVAGPSVQRYKAGYLPPDPNSVTELAAAGVQRGLMGRLWLERFLDAAQLPRYSVEALLATHFPPVPVTSTRRLQPNLPPPTYVRFVMRAAPYAALLAGLRSGLPVTLVVSLGGMGKTSLARAVAGACLMGANEAVPFDAVVWVSDKDRPGSTNLSITLDAVARVLDYPGIAALPFLRRQYEVEQLLRAQPVLLVMDNADTITDAALLEWLARVPAPSKALVTSRRSLAALGDAFLVPLGPMEPHELQALAADWLPRLRLRGLPLHALDQLAPLIVAVGGNPKVLQLALGLLQHRARDAVLDTIRGAHGEIFEELFRRAWEVLDHTTQRILLALALFPASAPAEALTFCADSPSASFASSIALLASLALVDDERDDLVSEPRYNAHTLVRAFALARWAELGPGEAADLRERWFQWCLATAGAVGFCWDDLDRLALLDREQQAIQVAISWAGEHGRDAELIALVEGVRYYHNVRGLWGDEELRNHERRAAAARRLNDLPNELLALAHLSEVLSKQGRNLEAASVLDKLIARGQALYEERLYTQNLRGADALSDDAAFEYGHALALYARSQSDLPAAIATWRQLLSLSARLGGQKYVVNRRWLATALLQSGDVAGARALFAASLEDAVQINDLRSIAGNTLKLAAIDLAQGELGAAGHRLAEARAFAARHSDKRRLAECHQLAARLHDAQGDASAARGEITAALNLFERLGMRNELHEARQAFAQYTHLSPDQRTLDDTDAA